MSGQVRLGSTTQTHILAVLKYIFVEAQCDSNIWCALSMGKSYRLCCSSLYGTLRPAYGKAHCPCCDVCAWTLVYTWIGPSEDDGPLGPSRTFRSQHRIIVTHHCAQSLFCCRHLATCGPNVEHIQLPMSGIDTLIMLLHNTSFLSVLMPCTQTRNWSCCTQDPSPVARK